MSRVFGRALLALGGVALGLLVLEALLQAGALVVGPRSLSTSWVTGSLRILSIGDSNTYGLWVARDETYPSQLETHWNATVDSPKIEVLNLGFPGTNSSRLRRDLPMMLETLAPDIVILKIGANDYWTVPVQYDDDYTGSDRKSFFERHSLVVKLSYMLFRAFDTTRLEVSFDEGGPSAPPAALVEPQSPRSVPRPVKGRTGTARFGDTTFELGFQPAKRGQLYRVNEKLQANIEAMVGIIREFGARPVLMTYASRFRVYDVANGWLRGAVEATGAELIDNAVAFEPLCPEFECPEFLFGDHHPKARGYGEIAKGITARLRSPMPPRQ